MSQSHPGSDSLSGDRFVNNNIQITCGNLHGGCGYQEDGNDHDAYQRFARSRSRSLQDSDDVPKSPLYNHSITPSPSHQGRMNAAASFLESMSSTDPERYPYDRSSSTVTSSPVFYEFGDQRCIEEEDQDDYAPDFKRMKFDSCKYENVGVLMNAVEDHLQKTESVTNHHHPFSSGLTNVIPTIFPPPTLKTEDKSPRSMVLMKTDSNAVMSHSFNNTHVLEDYAMKIKDLSSNLRFNEDLLDSLKAQKDGIEKQNREVTKKNSEIELRKNLLEKRRSELDKEMCALDRKKSENDREKCELDKKKNEVDSKLVRVNKTINETEEELQRTRALDSLNKCRAKEISNFKQEISFPNRRIAYRDLDRPQEGNETFTNPININVVGPLYQAKHLSSNVPQECSRKFKKYLDSNFCYIDKDCYICDLCDVQVKDKSTIMQHIRGRRHQDAVYDAEEDFEDDVNDDDENDDDCYDINHRYNGNKNIDLRSKLKNRN